MWDRVALSIPVPVSRTQISWQREGVGRMTTRKASLFGRQQETRRCATRRLEGFGVGTLLTTQRRGRAPDQDGSVSVAGCVCGGQHEAPMLGHRVARVDAEVDEAIVQQRHVVLRGNEGAVETDERVGERVASER